MAAVHACVSLCDVCVCCVAVYYACGDCECVVAVSVFEAISLCIHARYFWLLGMYMVCVWLYVMHVYIVCVSVCLNAHVYSCLVYLAMLSVSTCI